MTTTKRNYRATFIIDNRGKEDSVDQLIENLKKEVISVDGEIIAVENHGRRDFARKTNPKFSSGIYVSIAFATSSDGVARLSERLRLNSFVYRVLVENY